MRELIYSCSFIYKEELKKKKRKKNSKIADEKIRVKQ